MVSAYESTQRYVECSCERRQDALVDRLAGFEALERIG
jgi:hypothetical protein